MHKATPVPIPAAISHGGFLVRGCLVVAAPFFAIGVAAALAESRGGDGVVVRRLLGRVQQTSFCRCDFVQYLLGKIRTVAEASRRLGPEKVSGHRVYRVLGQPRCTQRYHSRRPEDKSRLLGENSCARHRAEHKDHV